MKYERTTLTVARWTARVVGLLVLLTIAALAIGEGGPNPFHLSLRENLLGLGLLTMMSGIVVGWKWEGTGGFFDPGRIRVLRHRKPPKLAQHRDRPLAGRGSALLGMRADG